MLSDVTRRERLNTKQVGRPPTLRSDRTTLARWMRSRALRTADLHAMCVETAERIGLPPRLIPPLKSLADIALGRYAANAAVLFLIRHVTNGEIDLEHWVRDLFLDNSQEEKLADSISDPLHANECHPPTAPVDANRSST